MQDDTETPLSSTFQQTEGGRTGPYKASAFDLTPCSDLPRLDAAGDVSRASEILNAYLVRVGANGTCLSDPNFQGLCNPPLSAATEYRWVWVLRRLAAGPSPDSGSPGAGQVCEATGLESLLCAETIPVPIKGLPGMWLSTGPRAQDRPGLAS